MDYQKKNSMRSESDFVIIGGGIVGLLTSYYLSTKGYSVKVVTEKDEANTASNANAGYIAASFGHPLPSVESLSNILKMSFARDSPLRISPRFLVKNIQPSSWLSLYLKSSPKRKSDEYLKAVRELCFEGARLLTSIIETNKLDVHLGEKGILEVYLNEKSLETNFRHLREAGGQLRVRLLSSSACLDAEPNLSKDVAGGVLYERDTYINPVELMASLKSFLGDKLGVKFVQGKAYCFEADSKRVSGVKISDGIVLKGLNYVVCNGAGATSLLSGLGIYLPLSPAYGYTIVTEPSKVRLRKAVVGGEFRVATSQTRDGRLRASGFFELRPEARTVVDKRCETIRDKASLYLPFFRSLEVVEKRYGARPCSPDGLPYVGRTGFDNLFVNVGHCRLGLTTGAATSKLLSDIFEGVDNRFADVLDPARIWTSLS